MMRHYLYGFQYSKIQYFFYQGNAELIICNMWIGG